MNIKRESKYINKKKDEVKKEIVNELTEDYEDIDLIKVDIQGLVSIINEQNIERFDLNEYNMNEIIQHMIQKSSNFNSFFLMDIGAVFRRYRLWKKLLPNIEMFYAIKCIKIKYIFNYPKIDLFISSSNINK